MSFPFDSFQVCLRIDTDDLLDVDIPEDELNPESLRSSVKRLLQEALRCRGSVAWCDGRLPDFRRPLLEREYLGLRFSSLLFRRLVESPFPLPLGIFSEKPVVLSAAFTASSPEPCSEDDESK